MEAVRGWVWIFSGIAQCSRQDKTQNISLASVTKSMDIGLLFVKATHNPDQPFFQGYIRLTRHGLHFLL